MTIHLMIVGSRPPGGEGTLHDDGIDVVGGLGGNGSTVIVRRCVSPGDLVKVVRAVALENNALVDTLDLHDHGARGHIRLGDDILFDNFGTGAAIAGELTQLLTVDARVRLLGCDVASGTEGQELLEVLRAGLGGSIVVYGTLAEIDPSHFDRNGFRREIEEQYLFSSTESVARVAPSWTARSNEIDAWTLKQQALAAAAIEPHTEAQL